MRKALLPIAGALTVSLLLWLAGFHKVVSHLQEIDPLIIAGICLLQLATILAITVQWKQFASSIGEEVPWGGMFYINMAGTFAESITPALKTGGEVTKVFLLRSKLGFSAGKAVALVSLQKTISIFAFTLLNASGILWFLIKYGSEGIQSGIVYSGFIFLLCLLLLLLAIFVLPLNRIIFLGRFRSFAESLQATLRRAVFKKKNLAYQVFLSFFIWILFAVKAYIIALSLRLDLDIVQVAVVTFISYMVSMVPLLPGGLGSFEASMTFLLIPLGVSMEAALTMALVLRFVTFWFVFLVSAFALAFYSIPALKSPAHR